MSDYGQKSRLQMMERYRNDRRKRWWMRQWYHFLDISWGVAWGIMAIGGVAVVIFLYGTRPQ